MQYQTANEIRILRQGEGLQVISTDVEPATAAAGEKAAT